MTSYRKMTPSDLVSMTFEVRSDWFDTRRRGECGEVVVGYRFSVVAELPNGLRWQSPGFATSVESDEDGFPHVWGAVNARKKAEALRRKVAKRPSLALEWEPTDPCYGSESWGRDAEWNQMDEEEQDNARRAGHAWGD